MRTFATLALLLAASALRAGAFHRQWANGGAERLLFCPEGTAAPEGWDRDGFDDGAWGGPVTTASGWFAEALQRPWSSYRADGLSLHQDDLLLRLRLSLPAGLARAQGRLELVVDDNAAVWLNGRAVLADDPSAQVSQQPRRIDLDQGWRACDNLLVMKVHSMNPVLIGYKFVLSVDGVTDGSADCGAAPIPASAALARRMPVTPGATAVAPPPAPAPAALPTAAPTSRLAALPLATPTPWPTRTPRPAPSVAPRRRPSQDAAPAGPSPTPTCAPPPPPGPGRWILPREPRVLARHAAFTLDRGHAELSLPFSLTATARVWAEAGGLWGLPQQQDGAPPEAFVDQAYAGPLLAELGGGWRSPQAFVLGPGPHQIELRVSSLGPAGQAGGAWLKALSDPQPVFRAAPTPTPCGCPDAPSRKDWPSRLKGGDLVLSVLSGRVQGAGLMAQLKDRDAWQCRVRLPADAAGRPLAVVASIHPMGPGLAQLVLGVDPDYRGPADALGYTPGAWEPLRLQWCAGRLTLRLAHAPAAVIALDPGPLGLELAAQDLELGLAPAR